MRQLKKFFFIAVIGGILYFFLSYHIIFIGSSPKLLKKSSLTLNYTFYNAKGKTNETILAIDELREDGIGDILYEEGRITEGELERLMRKFGGEDS